MNRYQFPPATKIAKFDLKIIIFAEEIMIKYFSILFLLFAGIWAYPTIFQSQELGPLVFYQGETQLYSLSNYFEGYNLKFQANSIPQLSAKVTPALNLSAENETISANIIQTILVPDISGNKTVFFLDDENTVYLFNIDRVPNPPKMVNKTKINTAKDEKCLAMALAEEYTMIVHCTGPNSVDPNVFEHSFHILSLENPTAMNETKTEKFKAPFPDLEQNGSKLIVVSITKIKYVIVTFTYRDVKTAKYANDSQLLVMQIANAQYPQRINFTGVMLLTKADFKEESLSLTAIMQFEDWVYFLDRLNKKVYRFFLDPATTPFRAENWTVGTTYDVIYAIREKASRNLRIFLGNRWQIRELDWTKEYA